MKFVKKSKKISFISFLSVLYIILSVCTDVTGDVEWLALTILIPLCFFCLQNCSMYVLYIVTIATILLFSSDIYDAVDRSDSLRGLFQSIQAEMAINNVLKKVIVLIFVILSAFFAFVYRYNHKR